MRSTNQRLRDAYRTFRLVYSGRDSRRAFSRLLGLSVANGRTPTLNNWLADKSSRQFKPAPLQVAMLAEAKVFLLEYEREFQESNLPSALIWRLEAINEENVREKT